MMKLALFFIFLLTADAFSQEFNFQFEPEAFPVEIEGWQVQCPWAGGYSETASEFSDIDSDGDLDLFAGSFWGTNSCFINAGSNIEPDFDFITREYTGIDVGGTVFYGRSDPAFVDIDYDGDYDMFLGNFQCKICYLENTGTIKSVYLCKKGLVFI